MSYDELCLGAATYHELRLGVNNYLPRATAPVARRLKVHVRCIRLQQVAPGGAATRHELRRLPPTARRHEEQRRAIPEHMKLHLGGATYHELRRAVPGSDDLLRATVPVAR